MNIFITGGMGLIGSQLTPTLLQNSHTVTLLTRNVENARLKWGATVTYCASLSDLKSLDGYDAVINLAGQPIAEKRWTEKQKEKLCQSRWNITRQLATLIKESTIPPAVFISGSAVGYYGDRKEEILTEDSCAGNDFTSQLCVQWEALALEAQSNKTNVCLLRTGIVLSPQGGALKQMLPPFRIGLGSVLGSGNQYMSWIHIDDMVGAIHYLLTTPGAQGAFNMTTQYPVTNKQFSKTLARVLCRPCWFFIPSFMLHLLLGERATLLLEGQRVLPQNLLRQCYKFKYADMASALNAIFGREN